VKPLLNVEDLTKSFALHAGLFSRTEERVYALNGVSLALYPGETYGLVGESGSGKTTLARTLVQLEHQDSGTLHYERGDETVWRVDPRDKAALSAYRRDVRYVFQDPSSSLDPRMTVGNLLTVGTLKNVGRQDRSEALKAAVEGLEAVGLRRTDWERRPSEFSGGQRQRIALARALVTRPRLLLCDEVVSALDVSVRGQILSLLLDLKEQFRLSMLFVAHDLDVVMYMADRVGVFYGGMLMEEADAVELASNPRHPYTQLLFSSAPSVSAAPPVSPVASSSKVLTKGCPFANRCPLVAEVCRTTKPLMRMLSGGPSRRLHRAACHNIIGS